MARTKFTPRSLSVRRAKLEQERENNLVLSWDDRISKWNGLCSLKSVLDEDPIGTFASSFSSPPAFETPKKDLYINPKKAVPNQYTQWEQDLFNNYPARPSKKAKCYSDDEDAQLPSFSDMSSVSSLSELTDIQVHFIESESDNNTDDELSSIASIHTLIV